MVGGYLLEIPIIHRVFSQGLLDLKSASNEVLIVFGLLKR